MPQQDNSQTSPNQTNLQTKIFRSGTPQDRALGVELSLKITDTSLKALLALVATLLLGSGIGVVVVDAQTAAPPTIVPSTGQHPSQQSTPAKD